MSIAARETHGSPGANFVTSTSATRTFGRRNAPKRVAAQPGRAALRGEAPLHSSDVAMPTSWQGGPAPARDDAATWRLRREGAAAGAILCAILIISVMEAQFSIWLVVLLLLGAFVCVKLSWHCHHKSQEAEATEFQRELQALENRSVVDEVPGAAVPNSFAAWRHKQAAFIIAFASGIATAGSAVAYFGVGKLSFGMSEPVAVLPAMMILCVISLTVIVPVILALVDYTRRRKVPRGIADVGIGITLTSVIWVPLLLLVPLDGADALLLALAMMVAGGVAGFQFWRYEGTIVR